MFRIIILVFTFLTFSIVPAIAKGENCSFIQAAINQLPAQGGEVIVRAGQYTCYNYIVINRNNVTLRGEGNATVLSLANGANSPVIIMGQATAIPTITRRNIHVKNISINGNRANQQYECWHGPCNAMNTLRNNGISIRHCEDCGVEGVTIYSTASGGLVTELNCQRLIVRGVTSFNNKYDGMAAYQTENSLFTNLNLHNNLAAGLSFDIKFNNNIVSNSILSDNAKVGIFMRDSENNSFQGLQIRNSGEHAIFLAQVDTDSSKPATGNIFLGVIVSQANGSGIRVNDASCVNNSVVGSQFSGYTHGCVYEGAPIVQSGNICH